LTTPFEHLLRDFGFPRFALEKAQRVPATDVIETAEGFTLQLDIPGVEQKDIEVKFEDDMLTVRAEHKQQAKNEKYHLYERRYSSFARQFSLPTSVDAGKAEASYKNGVLSITLPKREESKPRSISVKVS
jgi:HSP20 family protein